MPYCQIARRRRLELRLMAYWPRTMCCCASMAIRPSSPMRKSTASSSKPSLPARASMCTRKSCTCRTSTPPSAGSRNGLPGSMVSPANTCPITSPGDGAWRPEKYPSPQCLAESNAKLRQSHRHKREEYKEHTWMDYNALMVMIFSLAEHYGVRLPNPATVQVVHEQSSMILHYNRFYPKT